MRLLLTRRSYEQIVAEQHCSRRAVAAVKKRLVAEQITSVEQIHALSEQQLDQWFPDGRAQRSKLFGRFRSSARLDESRPDLHDSARVGSLRF